MNKKNDNTEKLIRQLRLSKPQLHNPEKLTEKIILALPERTKSNVLNRIRILSSVAAVFLSGLFIFQSNDAETHYFIQPSKIVQNTIKIEALKSCYSQSDLSVVQIYNCYLNENIIKNKKLRTLENKLNKNTHENFD